MTPTPAVSHRDNPRLRAELVQRLQPMLTMPESMAPPRWVAAELRDGGGRLAGGGLGLTTGLWLSIELLWVHEEGRRQGLGKTLVQLIELEAMARGCIGSYVETSSRVALLFYRESGYRTKLVREEAEPGLVRYTLQKRFQPAASADRPERE